MEVLTTWVKPPQEIGGLDHLAVQAPCINIYGRLLPGITNVTDRARYYSFYPWLIWALDQRGYSKYDDKFIDLFRKADCLFTLVAEHHAEQVKDEFEVHAAATVGNQTLASVARNLTDREPIRLSDYSHRDSGNQRYFMNKLGGLGQYYIEVLRELTVLDGDSNQGIKYTLQLGQALAHSMDQLVPRDLFLQTIEGDYITRAKLDELNNFCPCRIVDNPSEHKILCDLFFVRGLFFEVEALVRRRSLQIIISLAQELAASGYELSEQSFRSCVYSASLPGGQTWNLSQRLLETRTNWGIYACNELLSVAIQGLFYALLDAYEEAGFRHHSSQELTDWFISQHEIQGAVNEFGAEFTYRELVQQGKNWLPNLNTWSNDNHEVQLAESIVRMSRTGKSMENRRKIIVNSVKILIALAARRRLGTQAYKNLVFPGNYFQVYPINLQSFVHHTGNDWADLRLAKLLAWLSLHWCVNNHLRVALRKLRGQSKSTFRIRPSDQGFEVIGVPPAVNTRPRFNQSVRILKDLGVLTRNVDGHWEASDLGKQLLELSDAP